MKVTFLLSFAFGMAVGLALVSLIVMVARVLYLLDPNHFPL